VLQNNSILKSLIDKLWQNFLGGGIANPLIAIEQVTYLIFMKRLDDLEANRVRVCRFYQRKILLALTALVRVNALGQYK